MTKLKQKPYKKNLHFFLLQNVRLLWKKFFSKLFFEIIDVSIFCDIFWICLDFYDFWKCLRFFFDFLEFFRFLELNFFFSPLRFLGLFSNLLRLLLNVMEVTTEHRKWPLMSTNSVKSSFFAKGQKKPRRKAKALRRS